MASTPNNSNDYPTIESHCGAFLWTELTIPNKQNIESKTYIKIGINLYLNPFVATDVIESLRHYFTFPRISSCYNKNFNFLECTWKSREVKF